MDFGVGTVVLVLVVIVAIYAILIYNALVRATQMVKEAWSGIDVQLKRRADLIPNLVATVKAYAGHERAALDAVTELRARAQSLPRDDVAARGETEGSLAGADAADRRRRGLSRPQGQPELPRTPKGAIGDRERDPVRAALLQRCGAQSERQGRERALQHRRAIFGFRSAASISRSRTRPTGPCPGLRSTEVMYMISLRCALLVLCLLAVLAPLTVQAAEEIRSYHADIAIGSDGTLEVTERIRVNVEGREIRRGIFRDIPLRFEDETGRMREVGLDVVSVTRNGARTLHDERGSGILRVRIGDADVLIPHGEHTYEIAYRTDRQIRFFEEHDELYWNVTGNGWDFAILEASAEVRLPGNAGRARRHLFHRARSARPNRRPRPSGWTAATVCGFPPSGGLARARG
jgi:hypothetical protein